MVFTCFTHTHMHTHAHTCTHMHTHLIYSGVPELQLGSREELGHLEIAPGVVVLHINICEVNVANDAISDQRLALMAANYRN